jgi:hypothetical protein
VRRVRIAEKSMTAAWALSYGCKSRRELTIASEVKRNCGRVCAWLRVRAKHIRRIGAICTGAFVLVHADIDPRENQALSQTCSAHA